MWPVTHRSNTQDFNVEFEVPVPRLTRLCPKTSGSEDLCRAYFQVRTQVTPIPQGRAFPGRQPLSKILSCSSAPHTAVAAMWAGGPFSESQRGRAIAEVSVSLRKCSLLSMSVGRSSPAKPLTLSIEVLKLPHPLEVPAPWEFCQDPRRNRASERPPLTLQGEHLEMVAWQKPQKGILTGFGQK